MPASPEPLRVAAVVLAAGASSRMGSNKMLLEIDGEPLVRRAVRQAVAADLSPIIVVLGRDADDVETALEGLPCECAINPDFTGPTSGSLHQGLRRLPGPVDAGVVILADMVRVTEEMIRAVVRAGRDSGAPLVASRYGDVTAPPLLFRRVLFPELLAWNGEGCGKAVVRRHRHEAAFLDWPAEALEDVDTPEDFAAARRRATRS